MRNAANCLNHLSLLNLNDFRGKHCGRRIQQRVPVRTRCGNVQPEFCALYGISELRSAARIRCGLKIG